MKKLISAILVLSMVFAFASSAMAGSVAYNMLTLLLFSTNSLAEEALSARYTSILDTYNAQNTEELKHTYTNRFEN